MTLPGSRKAVGEDERSPVGEVACGRGERILLIDHDETARSALTERLRTIGYVVRSAGATREAAAVLDSGEPFDLMLADVETPGAPTPPDLARRARLARPGLRVLFMSGRGEDAVVHEGRVDPDIHLIEKLCSKDALAAKLRLLLDAKPGPGKADGPPRVLLVEDEPMIALAMADLLASFGYEVAEARDGATAKAAFDAHARIDVVLTDLGLPDIDGEALAEWARARRPHIPIVFSTGRDDFEAPPLLLQGGRVLVVQKPFDSETLRRTLEACAPLPA